jgi:hypothetical protein
MLRGGTWFDVLEEGASWHRLIDSRLDHGWLRRHVSRQLLSLRAGRRPWCVR